MRVHSGSHADRSDYQSDQADKAEKSGGTVQASRNIWVRFAEIDNQSFRKRFLQFGAHRRYRRGVWPEPEEDTLRGAAAQTDETRAIQSIARKHDTRSYVEAA